MALATSAIDVMWIVLSAFLAVVGLALAFMLLRLAGTLARLTGLLRTTEEKVVPLATKVGGTLDLVNLQLDKVDRVTDSAVDAADAADTAVRAVSMAVVRPVQKVSGLAKGVSHGASALLAGHDLKSAVAAGRDAAARREREIAEELAPSDRPTLLQPEPPPAAAPADWADLGAELDDGPDAA
ncbi:MAG: hypothetical protein IT201_03140 [Thermoleophilia bacterium]|nr:hypothetical protein [Thermoleophilia bacterium]